MMTTIKATSPLSRVLSIAPMLKRTHRHCRYFFRLIHPTIWLYSEMVTTGALLFGSRERHLDFHVAEYPVALQLGGSDPAALARCAKIGEEWGYNEINLNIGCPSERVQSGLFGACLMKDPKLVAACVRAMGAVVNIPITVKTRIGVDDQDSYEQLVSFIETIATAGCHTFILHARKAWLKGLSPKENREIPPLQYDRVYQIKQDFPQLEIIINGGIQTAQAAHQHLQRVDGVMIGRAVCQNPYLLSEFLEEPRSRAEVMEDYLSYMDNQLIAGQGMADLIQPIFGLFYRKPFGKQWRRGLSELSPKTTETVEILLKQAIEY